MASSDLRIQKVAVMRPEARIRFHRVRTEVSELWSGEPIMEAVLVQAAAESANNLEDDMPYPAVRAVEPTEGVWELFLPGDLVYELRRQTISELELLVRDRYFRIRFLSIPRP